MNGSIDAPNLHEASQELERRYPNDIGADGEMEYTVGPVTYHRWPWLKIPL